MTPETEDRRRRPAILIVDDEPAVLAAVARDVRRQFGADHQILRAESGEQALELLDELQRRGQPVALLIADQRMPGMAGTDFLAASRQRVPDARRVLLTAYADTEAAIQAINEVGLDYYLLKPWDPPEEHLYPVIADLLAAWGNTARIEAGGLRLIGHRFSKDSHDLRDFLARNRVPAQWFDIERDEEAQRLLKITGVGMDRLPVAVLEDGGVLERPTIVELADRLGLRSVATQEHYDVVIVGGGPAGLAAAVYGASEGLRTVLVEREATGGQAGQSSLIENYLGFPNGLSGSELASRATMQARRLGAEMLAVQDASALVAEGAGRLVRLSDGTELSTNCVIIASGVAYRQMEAPGFAELTGAGVYYGAAITEARSCQDQHVTIIGGANSAGQAAVYFSRFATEVTMLVRAPTLEQGMSAYLVEQLRALENVDVRTGAQAVAAESRDGRLHALRIRDADGSETSRPTDACFVFIGAVPRTDWLDGVVARDERGFILAGPDARRDGWPLQRDPYVLESSVPGVFVAGDVRARSVKRVASAVGEGSMAVSLVHQYLADV
ncbi:MAG: Thioredoxin reductase [uncultured Solirubrobacteraceae bacterium]|uniref:Thioredoxin reductase n=1 Tax=uncultured Solirubrobacteraceae bacterium TaxID=1162706 RepID=A0A6J4RBG3_9ACTN|nr:MAG: Thioredoxin reductase [uncultured Solirubrobacteraceae bacterium]